MVTEKYVEYLIVDTTAFIQNAPLQEIGTNIITIQEVVDEITNKRQLRRLVVLPYDLIIKEVFPENVKIITEFAKKTGDYTSLSATDIKVMALTYQLEKEHVGVTHLNTEPKLKKTVDFSNKPVKNVSDTIANVAGFYLPANKPENLDDSTNSKNLDKILAERFEKLDCQNGNECDEIVDDILKKIDNKTESNDTEDDDEVSNEEADDDEDDEDSWITPSNIKTVKKQINSQYTEEKEAKVACITTDFAMQNVLKQMNLNVSALDGRLIKELRTFILRCYACFNITSLTTKRFCPKCGNDTLKKVAVSLDENGKQKIHINGRKPLTGRGKKYSLPTFKGGKHSNNPLLCEDQPRPDQKPTRLARMKNNPMDYDYIAGFSPFVMRDVNSKSAQLCIRPGGQEVKHWMKKNPNETRKKRK